jgi:putative ABC transport system permease protein
VRNAGRQRFSRPHLWLIRVIGVLVPRRLRLDWRQEWEAELRYREMLLADWGKLDWQNKLDLLRRSLGAFWDALLLQPQRWEDEMMQDLRFGVRMLLKQPGFTLIAVLTLALGIGANTAIFSVVNALVFRPLPFTDAGRLVWIANTGTDGRSGETTRVNNYLDWRARNQSFADLAAYYAFSDYASFNLTGRGEPERLSGYFVTQNFLSMLGVQPLLGRNFNEAESQLNGPKVVLLSYGFWQRRFGSDPKLLGQTITLNDQKTLVAGVLPPTFDFASVFTPGVRVEMLAPFPAVKELDGLGNTLAVVGRLKPGNGIAQAQAEFDLLNQQLKQANPGRPPFGARLTGLQQQVSGGARRGLFILFAAVGCVLLIACANLSNLMLVRASARRKEIAVRLALGATRLRLMRQLLTESVLLAVGGAAVGLLLAQVVTKAIASSKAFNLPLLQSVKVDGVALLFTLAVAVGAALLFGIIPALQATGTDMREDLQDATRGSSAGRQSARWRDALVVAEIALACVLLIGASLLIRSFLRVLETDPGFRAEQAVTWRIEAGGKYKTAGEVVALYAALTERVAALPGVASVGLTDTLPLGRNRSWDVRVKGQQEREGIGLFPRMVDPGYLGTMGISLRAGRNFSNSDNSKTEQVTILSEALAKRLFPGQDAIGRQAITGGREYRVIGVVGSVRHSSLEQEAEPEMYFPLAQATERSVDLVVRATLPPSALAQEVRRALHSVDANLPVSELRTLAQIVAQSVSPRRFVALLLSGFAGLALVLAALGSYGVIAFSVAERTPEFGIRLALGAQNADVLKLVLGQGARLIALGIAIGLLAAFALTRALQSLLFGVAAIDPLTFAAIPALLAAVALVACWLPARRATKVNPLTALRHG